MDIEKEKTSVPHLDEDLKKHHDTNNHKRPLNIKKTIEKNKKIIEKNRELIGK